MWDKMTPWRELGRLRQILLILLVVLLTATTLGYCYQSTRKGLSYAGHFLERAVTGDETRYEGEMVHQPVVLTVANDRVTVRVGSRESCYTVREDPAARPEQASWELDPEELRGMEVLEGKQVFFRGGVYRSGDTWRLFDEDGSYREEDFYGKWGVPTPTAVVTLYLGPRLTHPGNLFFLFLALLMGGIGAANMLFSEAHFRWSVSLYLRNVEEPEPSDWTLTGLRFSWLLLFGLCGYLCWVSLFFIL